MILQTGDERHGLGAIQSRSLGVREFADHLRLTNGNLLCIFPLCIRMSPRLHHCKGRCMPIWALQSRGGILMLDVAIGMALIYLLFSGLVSGIQEVVAQLLALRGKLLSKGVELLLGGRRVLVAKINLR
ncbi:MAG: hypothetical protein IPM73_12305 [Betaproteobacteria bacterium]|nr:hypothetical protein [Betaproteobacteria bacterium]